jgi:acyl-CoA synthetase (AMP-forming)/AMP-acid ligase II
MQGLMMGTQLLISTLIEHAGRHNGDTQIVSRRVEGDIHRTNWSEVHRRSKRLANALIAMGVKPGDRVATIAWNGYRHLEIYYAVSGIGAVLHTINPRLHSDQVAWIVNHAEDQHVFFDATFLPIVQAVHARCPTVVTWTQMTDRDRMPASSGDVVLHCYEETMAASSDHLVWPSFDENTASSLCYTSGTTGNPKGVLYSHRSTVLHAFAASLPDVMCLSASDSVVPIVPMFHVNAWGIPYAAAMIGCKLVFPGPALDGKSVYELFENEGVTFSAGVPTVWLGLINYLKQNNLRFSTLKRTVIGGSACPPAIIRTLNNDYDVRVIHGWGMSEMSPLGTTGQLLNKHRQLPIDEQLAILGKQGRALYGVDMKIVDPEGKELPWDGVAFGDLYVRGPWVIREYFKGDGGDPLVTDEQGVAWFPTGDVANIDADSYLQITDRSKDVIKSGGEWIGSIDLENIAMAHPAVAMAAVIAVPHPKWDERPLLVVVKKPDAIVEKADLIAYYEGKIAKWWTPDDVVFVDAIPLGATGKMLKTKLRESFRDYKLPTA